MTNILPRIFLIGFNKCGTTSFHDYFEAITSISARGHLSDLSHSSAYLDVVIDGDVDLAGVMR